MNPVHPPPPTAPTSETLGPANHPGTPVFTILGLTGKQPFGLSTPPVADLPIYPLVSRFQFPAHFLTL
ncbi:hypothetical protein CHARACLAT_016013 [Characodon lateralis]|uniref:Uncharacterized protein n=1 Tax=Characodon lateralis TaxID=208331 RepID=A0ABU7E0V8_9TELE|nr:hypothetical protein [Characodon lateralis]